MNGINYPNNNQAIFRQKTLQNASTFQNGNYTQNIIIDTSSVNNELKHSNFYNNTFYNNYPYKRNRNTAPNPKVKKRVKFNERVDVTIVKSFKKYNKCEKELTLDELIDNRTNSKKRKNSKNCECNIF